jgi:hypothetical protein
MKKYLLGIATALACAVGPVFAADLGVAYKAPYVAPPSWAGFYIGGSLVRLFLEQAYRERLGLLVRLRRQ